MQHKKYKQSMKDKTISYQQMTSHHFEQIIALAIEVHGQGYTDLTSLTQWFNQGIKNDINANYVALDGDKVVGFRITFAPQQWKIDKWCSPDKWGFPEDTVSYFKCNTVNENYRGYGIGSQLLKLSMAACVKQGAKAGIAHLWRQSPGNSAVKYFTKCGGTLVQDHPDRWYDLTLEGYECPVCDKYCHCVAAEMILDFQS